jgi:predicted sugar kinase
MATILESGKLQLSPEEVISYRRAADHLHDSCQMPLDLSSPITLEEWLLLSLTDAALEGDLSNLDRMLERIQDEIRLRNQRQ